MLSIDNELQSVNAPNWPGPIHQEADQWYFWIETWADRFGPFPTREAAEVWLNAYARSLDGDGKLLSELFRLNGEYIQTLEILTQLTELSAQLGTLVPSPIERLQKRL